MVVALANFFQLFIFTNFVRKLSFGKIFTEIAQGRKPFFPQKKTVYLFRMKARQSHNRVKTADGKLIGKFIPHLTSVSIFFVF
jgi:hypothetical protein